MRKYILPILLLTIQFIWSRRGV